MVEVARDPLTPPDVTGTRTVDASVLERIRAGDQHAKRELFDACGERTWRLVFRVLGDYDDAHDVAQETFLRAFDRAGSYSGQGTVQSWIASIALNLARDHVRKVRRRQNLLTGADIGSRASRQNTGDPLVAERVRVAVDNLSDVERVVVLMHDVEQFTHDEIGAALGIAPGSSRARLSRARAHLRELLADLMMEPDHE